MSLKGNTTDFPLDVLLRLLTDQKKTGELVLRGAQGEGALGLAEGRVVTAVYGDEPPIPALGAVFDLAAAEFEFTPWDEAPASNLEGELQDNLRKADEHKKWLAAVREVIPHDRLRFRLSERAAEQGAVTFTSDRWRVVLAVNGQRDVADLATHLQIDKNAALNLLSGLVRDGVIETIEPPASAEAMPAQSWSAPVTESAPPPPPPVMEAEPPPPPPVMEAAPEAYAVMEPPPPPAAPREDWSAALLRNTPAAAPEPPPPAPEPTFSAPAPAAREPMTAPEPAAPVADPWATTPQPAAAEWTAPSATPPSPQPASDEWSGTSAAPPTAEWSGANAAPPAPEWSAPPSAPVEPAAPAPDWAPAAPAEPAQAWTPPAPVEPEPAPAQVEPAPAPLDDRLAALFGSAPAESPSPSTDQWSAPAPAADRWGMPAPAADQWTAPAAPDTAQAEDPRLAAMRLPPAPSAPAAAPVMPPNEWAPPPAETPAPQKKRGLFGLGKRDEPAPARGSGAAVAEPGAGSRAGQLAAFSNALLNEFNSGKYGKARVDDRMPSLLMRVDEQADPIDRPLPVVDDRLDVQAMERVSLAEEQAVPYLAFLVSTIYGDAEKAFGRDKAKKGYKAAYVQLFGGDASALAGPDLAGKLPKV